MLGNTDTAPADNHSSFQQPFSDRTASMSSARRFAVVAISVLGFAAAGLIGTPAATATPGQVVDGSAVNALCQSQYPPGDGFQHGTAYLVAPSDAYSWRCKRAPELANGGSITDLPIDPTAFCTNRQATPAGNGPNWVCN